MPSDGTTGFAAGADTAPASDPVDSLSSATAVCTRLSIPWTYEIANAPSEWPTIATRVVRPGVSVLLSGERSNSFQYGLKPLTFVSLECGDLYGLPGVERKKSSASVVPCTKFDACCAGTPG